LASFQPGALVTRVRISAAPYPVSMMMNVIGPPLLGERMRYPLVASIVLLLSFFVTLPLLVLLFMGESSRILEYVIVLTNIFEMPFLLLTLYGFWLLGRYLKLRLLEYPVYVMAFIYILFIVFDSLATWVGWDSGQLYELISLGFVLLDGLVTVVFSIGLIQLRGELGFYASALGVLFFLQGILSALFALVSSISVIGFLFYLGSFLLFMVVYPLMAAFFYEAGKRYRVVGGVV